jgi:hypothetical protein
VSGAELAYRYLAAGEDQPEPLVVDDADRLGRFVVVQQLSLLLLAVAFVLAPDPVDGHASGGGGQPAAGVGGYAAGRPPPDGGRERLGRRFLGDVEVTERLARAATTRAHSSRWARLIASCAASASSAVQTEPPSPNELALASATASAASLTRYTTAAAPNSSSLKARISG